MVRILEIEEDSVSLTKNRIEDKNIIKKLARVMTLFLFKVMLQATAV